MSVDVGWLRRRYLEDQAPVSAIATEAGVDRSTIHRWLHAADIPLRGPVGRRDWDKILTPRALRAARKRGEEPADIARRFGAPYKVVADRLRNLGLLEGPSDAEMARQYEAGESLRAIAAEAGISPRTAARRIRAAGVKMRPPGRPSTT